MTDGVKTSRDVFESAVRSSIEKTTELCVRLTQTNSENPPGDTRAIASFIEKFLSDYPAVVVRRVSPRENIVNLVVQLRGRKPGRRLVLNGHLDTFPIGDAKTWSMPPLGGTIHNNRIYGRGVSDMKAGLAASIMTFVLLAERHDLFDGEIVLALVGDEETGGLWGTQYLLDNVPEASGDAMISGDAGSPQVIRFGEKGQVWLELSAVGRSAHGAHVHLGVNAIDRLTEALVQIRKLQRIECKIPKGVMDAINSAAYVSEIISGKGERETLQHVTVNVGCIEGGTAVNIVPDAARAKIDIRFPPGLTVDGIVSAAKTLAAAVPDVSLQVLGSSEANVTDPREEIVSLVIKNARSLLGQDVVGNMRVGFSDARFYRYRGVPSVVYGPTPYGMGGPDEYVTIKDLEAVLYVHAMTAFDYLAKESD